MIVEVIEDANEDCNIDEMLNGMQKPIKMWIHQCMKIVSKVDEDVQ